MLARYPQLRAPPEDSALGLDTPLPPPIDVNISYTGHLIPFESVSDTSYSSTDKGKSKEPSDAADAEPPLTWGDVAISIGAELMEETRQAVLSELGYSLSAGIAPNKTLAKLCAGYNKPDAQVAARKSDPLAQTHTYNRLFCGHQLCLASCALFGFRRSASWEVSLVS